MRHERKAAAGNRCDVRARNHLLNSQSLSQRDAGRRFYREQAREALAVFRFHIVSRVDRHDFEFWDNDVQQQNVGGLIADAGQIRANGYTPAVREAVLAAMTAQTNLLQALLAGVERGDVPPWTINPERRNNLMKHKDDSIRERSTALFKDLQSGDRMKVYEEYKSVLALTPRDESITGTSGNCFSGLSAGLKFGVMGFRRLLYVRLYLPSCFLDDFPRKTLA